jgi:hypothetical protein
MRVVALTLIAFVSSVAVHAQAALQPFPDPTKTVRDEKQFNATTFGPGNTISVHEASDDLQLEAFDFDASETALFTEWKSGRLETRDIDTDRRMTEIKPIFGRIWEAYGH